ncbi:AAA ATPase central domain protein [Halorhabdus utahensis DSM 12940]|uniref:Replication factor C large subunit n=1 Tax=Halorhabdus utahensis (strain DSM 12940 / JCM 11049 / AX-2) TaxID=519442 RepID=C7NRZ7_HALUD|nr:replication factor C large subunit [Halorhabdus utahensis]ACV13172.1 AAA ATPase central domain protein [Halorhabdus utahensis DSM 12940]
MTDWTEIHRPSTLAEVRGNDKARDALREWAESWPDHREAVVLYGSPGIGKTSAAHALANDMDWPTIELNASDSRTKDVIEQVAGEAAKSGTLAQGGSGRRLVILDEADNLHGNVDRGGTRAITSLVKEAQQPIVLIANEFYEMSKGLRNACRDIEFRDVSTRSIVPVLRDICRQEDVGFEKEALRKIAEMNDGDLRGAINDLQAIAEGRDTVTEDDVVTSERDRTTDIFSFLDTVLKEADAQEALEASYDVDETPDDLISWIEDNVPKDYEGAELARAYRSLANADRWLGRVRATQNYTFWRYASDAMTAGVAAARSGEKGGWTRYGPPSYWSKLGRTRGARDTRDDVARAIATTSGVSMSTARREVLPYLETMTHHCKNRELTVSMTAAYDLDADHVAFITGSGADTNKIASIIEDAAERRETAAVDASEGAFDPGETDSSSASGDEQGDDQAERAEGATLGSQPADGGDDASMDEAAMSAEDEEGARSGEEEDANDQQTGLGDFV